MSNLSSGLIPLSKGRTASGPNSSSGIASLGGAPSISKQNDKVAKNNDSDDDLDALFDDEPKIGTVKTFSGKVTTKSNVVPTQRKFKSTMKDFSDSEDNSNNFFDDSSSSVGLQSPVKGGGRPGAFDDSLSPMSDRAGGASPHKANLLENVSFASDDLDDSILGGFARGTGQHL